MNKIERDIKSELEDLKNMTRELKELKSLETCENCNKYAALAFRTAEKYFEMLVRAEIIESTWYKKGGTDCSVVACECKKENQELRDTLETARAKLGGLLGAPFTEADMGRHKKRKKD